MTEVIVFDTGRQHEVVVGKAPAVAQHDVLARGIHTNVTLTAVDADVIKGYVEVGVGVGILAKMAFDPGRDTGLRLIDAAHLFEPSTTRIAIRRNAYLRGYVYDFIELFAPHLAREVVEKTMRGPGTDYEL